MQHLSSAKRQRSPVTSALLVAGLVPAACCLARVLAGRPAGLTAAQWRAVRRAARTDAHQSTCGTRLCALLASATDLDTRIALADAYWECLGVEAPYNDD